MCPDRQKGEFRAPTDEELSLLTKLISTNFEGAATLAQQVLTVHVMSIDPNGSLRLWPDYTEPATVSRRIPVEATYPDADDVIVHVLLHVVDGLLNELEIYREDARRVVIAATVASALEIDVP